MMRMHSVKHCSRVRQSLIIGLTVLTLTVTNGCATMTSEQEGQIIGGVIGGIVGSQIGDGNGKTIAIIAGTVVGSMIGRHIGQTMDDNDRMKTAQALTNARTGESRTWYNENSGHRYTVTPIRDYAQAGAVCRDFQLDALTEETSESRLSGTACQQNDESWLLR